MAVVAEDAAGRADSASPGRGWLEESLALLPAVVRFVCWCSALAAAFFMVRAFILVLVVRPPTLRSLLAVAAGDRLVPVDESRPLPASRNPLHAKARRWRKKGLLPEACRLYEQLLRERPDCYDYNLEYAETLFAAGEYESARMYVERARRLRPSALEVLVLQSRILFSLGREAEALRLASKAALVARKMGDGKAENLMRSLYEALGRYYMARRRWRDAFEFFERADPECLDARIQYLAALCCYRSGLRRRLLFWKTLDHETAAEAVKHLERSLRMDPVNPAARELLRRIEKMVPSVGR